MVQDYKHQMEDDSSSQDSALLSSAAFGMESVRTYCISEKGYAQSQPLRHSRAVFLRHLPTRTRQEHTMNKSYLGVHDSHDVFALPDERTVCDLLGRIGCVNSILTISSVSSP